MDLGAFLIHFWNFLYLLMILPNDKGPCYSGKCRSCLILAYSSELLADSGRPTLRRPCLCKTSGKSSCSVVARFPDCVETMIANCGVYFVHVDILFPASEEEGWAHSVICCKDSSIAPSPLSRPWHSIFPLGRAGAHLARAAMIGCFAYWGIQYCLLSLVE